jgi:GNAT superfamily N-acetyltransferase
MICTAGQRLEVRSADPGELARHKPDVHFEWICDEEVRGRCSLWWTGIPAWNGHRVGMIGHYSASGDGASGFLEYACRQLREQGCTLAVGPMDGSTWRSYRLITSFGDEPRFFLEPDNPPEWVEHFLSSGFEPLARYFSALNNDLTRTDPRIERRSARLTQTGITLRPIRSEAFEEDLRKIYVVSQVVFRDNLLYADPDESEFIEMYRPLLGKVPLELILLAEHAGRPVGFVFAVPDLKENLRGESIIQQERQDRKSARTLRSASRRDATTVPKTVIIKTLAALPHRQYAGLGQLLLAEVQRRAHDLGFSRAIHALVRDWSHLRRISSRYAQPIREYTLFARVLSQ